MTRRKTRKGRVHVRLHYIAVEREQQYCQGLGRGARFGAVPQTYFPLRTGCHVTLYQNAFVATDEVRRVLCCNVQDAYPAWT